MLKNIWEIKGGYKLNTSKFKIMGILNITHNSFYDGGKHLDFDDALNHALKMIEEGADILDIGGESTRPGSCRITSEEELNKILPVIKALSGKIDIPISCDTYKAEVAVEAIKAGVSIINDISGFSFDKELLNVLKDTGCGYVLMHMQKNPTDMQVNPFYTDVIREISEFFETKLNFISKKGIDLKKVVLDPGIGFGKRLEDNLKIIKSLDKFQKFNRPLLIGTSRKSFIGNISNSLPVEKRLEGSLASAVISYTQGARIFRTHDVEETKNALKVTEAIEKTL